MRALMLILAALVSTFAALGPSQEPALGVPSLSDLEDRKASDIRPQDVIEWMPFEASEDNQGTVTVQVRMTVKEDWKVYAHNLKFAGPPGFAVTKIAPPPSRRIQDPISGDDVDVYEGGEFQLTLTGSPRWDKAQFPIDVTYVGCTQVICLFPYTQALSLPYRPQIATAPEPKTSTSPSPTPDTAPTLNAARSTDAPAVDLEARLASHLKGGGLPLSILMLIVFAGGLLSNLTPCVYPMIPITLRVLGRQTGSPYIGASFYAVGIVLTYSSLGLAAALSGGLFGSLLASKTFNVTFALIMAALGTSMLGFGDLSKLQVLGSRLGSGKPSHTNALLMGIGAGLVAAPCTGPILAALLAYIAGNNASVAVGAGLLFVYSLGFALPYIALGGAAGQLAKTKVSPMVQVATKIIFASVMFALAFYYLRVPLYRYFVELRPHWKPLTLGAGSLGVGLALLWVKSSNLPSSKYLALIPTFFLGTALFASSQWATTKTSEAASIKLEWLHEEGTATQAAEASGKPILIDMWAEWCEACKKLDITTFKDPEVMLTLSQDFILLKLDLTELDPQSELIQKKYEIQSLPTLVLLPPSGDLAQKELITGYVEAGTLLNELRRFRLTTTK